MVIRMRRQAIAYLVATSILTWSPSTHAQTRSDGPFGTRAWCERPLVIWCRGDVAFPGVRLLLEIQGGYVHDLGGVLDDVPLSSRSVAAPTIGLDVPIYEAWFGFELAVMAPTSATARTNTGALLRSQNAEIPVLLSFLGGLNALAGAVRIGFGVSLLESGPFDEVSGAFVAVPLFYVTASPVTAILQAIGASGG